MSNLRLNLKGLMMMALAGAMSIPSQVMSAMRAQNKLDDTSEAERQSHFRSGRSHEEKCIARRGYASLHPNHINRRRRDLQNDFFPRAPSNKTAPNNMSRSAPAGSRWEFGRLVPRDLPTIR